MTRARRGSGARSNTGTSPMATTRPERIASALRLTIESKPLWLETSGGSMGRSIVPGSEILVASATRPRRGEVWAFCDDAGTIVAHRCRGRRATAYLFEGDAVGRADLPVPHERLVGRVVASRSGSELRRFGRLEAVRGTIATLVRRGRRRLRTARDD